MADDPSEDDLYEFAPQTSPPPACRIPPSPIPKPKAPPTLSYQVPKDEPRTSADTDTIKNIYMPLGLLAGGVLIEIVDATMRSPNPGPALRTVGFDLAISTVAMLIGILLAARFRSINLGPFWIVVFKLAAISVAPSAVVDLVGPLLQLIPIVGGLLGLAVEFILYFALLGALFDLDESDTWFCLCVIFLVSLLISFGIR
jgi:hypothetical protein